MDLNVFGKRVGGKTTNWYVSLSFSFEKKYPPTDQSLHLERQTELHILQSRVQYVLSLYFVRSHFNTKPLQYYR